MKLLSIILMNILLFSEAHAQVQKIDLRTDLSNKSVSDLYGFSGKKSGKLTPLAQLKDYELHLKWNECLNLAPQVYTSNKDVKGWVARTWLHCLSKAQSKKGPVKNIEKILSTIGTSQSLFLGGPWSEDLREAWIEQQLLHLQSQVEKKQSSAAKSLDALLKDFSLNRDQKSKVFQLLADIAFQKKSFSEAQFLYEQAQDQKDSSYIQGKLAAIGKIQKQERDSGTRTTNKQKDVVPDLEGIVEILNQSSSGRQARRLKSKPLEIYSGQSDSAAKKKILEEMLKADAVLLLEWAQSLHRRGDYAAALALSERAAEKNPSSPEVADSLWIAGRCAHFLGQYDRALTHFEKLSSTHEGADQADEALFRSGLIYYRKKNFKESVRQFEKVIQQGRERYDLGARYWLVRALQELKQDRANQEVESLTERYPFSYYGLRLRAEAQGHKVTWPTVKEKNPKLTKEFYLVGSQKVSWKRFKVLSDAGWVSEAQAELSDLPFMSDPSLKMSLALALAQRHQYLNSIRLINDVMEKSPDLRLEQFVKVGYPAAFVKLYEVEADRYGIHPVLFRSLTRQESGYSLRAVSTSNALGLMQMIPPTAQEVAKKLNLKIELPEDMFRPEVNIPMGTFYVSQMLGQFENNIPFALAAYNAGPYRMRNWLQGRSEVSDLLSRPSSAPEDEIWFDELPWSETSFYVKAILRNVILQRLVDEGAFTLKPVLWQDLLRKKAK